MPYPVIDFHQYGGDQDSDRLVLFAAKAKDLAAWAGIPRKGWRIRMLFQRWITPGRERELSEFWERASTATANNPYILGPTAIVVALQGDPIIIDGNIHLDFNSPIEAVDSNAEKLQILARLVLPKIRERICGENLTLFENFSQNPLTEVLPNYGHDYVLEFALQLLQMGNDPEWFIMQNAISDQELPGLIVAMEALVRPALVVDGQHRLWGAQATDNDVFLPVVGIVTPNWPEQIYQFVVINEKAQKVDSELLNDIFASSLTPQEQNQMRDKFKRVKVDIEERIAGVLAGRDPESPFQGMVTLNLPNPPATEIAAYISQTIIQSLIEGGRGARGWRSDDAFFEHYIKPTFPDRQDWEDWRNGAWRRYWFSFWKTVIAFYTPRAKRIKGQDFEIWSKTLQSNLTKGVGLKMFQRFFMETCIQQVDGQTLDFDLLVNRFGQEAAQAFIEDATRGKAIPIELDEFVNRINEFLEKFPVRFFTANWAPSLDSDAGRENLLYQMREAYTRENWHAAGGGVFVPAPN